MNLISTHGGFGMGSRRPHDHIENSECLSELEYALYVATPGFWRWQVHCAEAAGANNLSALDIEVLHTVNNRARNKKLSDICLVLNIPETHTVLYSLRKLKNDDLIEYSKSSRDRIYCSSSKGDELCKYYKKNRDKFLIGILERENIDFKSMKKIAQQLIQLSYYYEEAGRAATIASARVVSKETDLRRV